MEVVFGQRYIDKVTKFTGTCVGHVEYATGCNQALLAPTVDFDGKLRESHWFDVQRLEQTDYDEILTFDNTDNNGCDIEAPKRT